MNNRKKKLLKRLVLWSDQNVLQIALLMVIFILTVIGFIYSKLNPLTLIDVTILSSFVITFAASILFTSIIDRLRVHVEDDIKINYDFDNIVNKYLSSNIESLYTSSKGKVWPMTILYQKEDDIKLKIEDSLDLYTTPREIINYSVNLIDIHKSSIVTNNLMIRLDDVIKEGNQLILKTSRTTYINSLITNRAMDYQLTHTGLNEGLTVRDMLEPGPYINPLNISKLSNHIGYNMLIETSDGYYCFKTRGFDVSISKGTVSLSMTTTLKSKSALNDDLQLTIESIEKSIKEDAHNFLNIKLNDFSFKDDLYCIYRELYEGGKPQFLFYKKINITKDEWLSRLDKEKFTQSLIFLNHEEFKNLQIDENLSLTDHHLNKPKTYEFSKATIASLVFLHDKLVNSKYEEEKS